MKDQLAGQIKLGKTRDEIRDYFVATYHSQEPLGAPIDRGFNRLAWVFPYLVGATGIVAIGFAAVKWSRHDDSNGTQAPPIDADVNARIDDELRDLD